MQGLLSLAIFLPLQRQLDPLCRFLISPSGVTKTAALSSNDNRTPFSRLMAYFCLIMTAPKICLRSSEAPFLTVTVTKSPTAAAGNRECLPLYRPTCAIRKIFAPVLSAQTNSAVIGKALVMYGRNSSTPFAETALVLAANRFSPFNHYERNSL